MTVYILSFILTCGPSHFSVSYRRPGIADPLIFLLLVRILQTYHQIYRDLWRWIKIDKCIHKKCSKIVFLFFFLFFKLTLFLAGFFLVRNTFLIKKKNPSLMWKKCISTFFIQFFTIFTDRRYEGHCCLCFRNSCKQNPGNSLD